ncbi:MAG TPA: hypothetical protein VHW69_09900 [Rhizomicrobium sp.]|jgi:hypothetical protein|nr:hypothetical protein [Rhizomicrobium sp.]
MLEECSFSSRPLVTYVDVAAEILTNGDLRSAYRLVKTGDLRTIPGPGRKRVLVASIETLVAQRLTAADFEAAEARAAPKRDKRKAYLKNYHSQKPAPQKQKTRAA